MVSISSNFRFRCAFCGSYFHNICVLTTTMQFRYLAKRSSAWAWIHPTGNIFDCNSKAQLFQTSRNIFAPILQTAAARLKANVVAGLRQFLKLIIILSEQVSEAMSFICCRCLQKKLFIVEIFFWSARYRCYLAACFAQLAIVVRHFTEFVRPRFPGRCDPPNLSLSKSSEFDPDRMISGAGASIADS